MGRLRPSSIIPLGSIPKIKKFGGKTYFYRQSEAFKAEALKRVRELRNSGKAVRLVKAPTNFLGIKTYLIYWRPKNMTEKEAKQFATKMRREQHW